MDNIITSIATMSRKELKLVRTALKKRVKVLATERFEKRISKMKPDQLGSMLAALNTILEAKKSA